MRVDSRGAARFVRAQVRHVEHGSNILYDGVRGTTILGQRGRTGEAKHWWCSESRATQRPVLMGRVERHGITLDPPRHWINEPCGRSRGSADLGVLEDIIAKYRSYFLSHNGPPSLYSPEWMSVCFQRTVEARLGQSEDHPRWVWHAGRVVPALAGRGERFHLQAACR